MKVALKVCAINDVSPQCECFDGVLRDLCECCDDDSLMPVSQRHEAESLDSTVLSEYQEVCASWQFMNINSIMKLIVGCVVRS